MKMFYTRMLLCVALLSATCFSPVWGQEEEEIDLSQWPGYTCENPLAVTKDFSYVCEDAWSYWFTAHTYDLPLHARYTVKGERENMVVAYVDFGCTTGDYGDEQLEDVVTSANGWGVAVPMEFQFTRTYNAETNYTYFDLEISESYRELLAEFGITYNVKAYVNLVTQRPGEASLVPDSTFRACIERSHWMGMPDSVGVSQSTIDSVYVFPFADWQGDSVRIRWTGTQQNVAVYIGNKCDFPLDQYDGSVVDYFTLTPGGYMDYSADMVKHLINLNAKGGIYYARAITTESAALIVEPKPISGPLADAIEIEKGHTYDIAADDTTQYYCFRKNWSEKLLQISATGTEPITAYFGTTPDFVIAPSSKHYITSKTFVQEADSQVLYLTLPELQQMIDKVNKDLDATTDFIFVRFLTAIPTQITPATWKDAGECVANTILLPIRDVLSLYSGTSYPTYRIKHADWAMQDMDFWLDGASNTYLFIGDTCTFPQTVNNQHVLYFKKFAARDTLTITSDTLRSMESRADGDGYLYVQFLQGQTTGEMHVFPHPKSEGPATAISNTSADSDIRVGYLDHAWAITTPTAQTLYLYNSLGALVATWQQAANEQKMISAPASGIYILRTDKKAVLLRR